MDVDFHLILEISHVVTVAVMVSFSVNKLPSISSYRLNLIDCLVLVEIPHSTKKVLKTKINPSSTEFFLNCFFNH